MSKVATLAVASALHALFLSSSASAAGWFVPVGWPPEATAYASILGLNDRGEVAGSYSTDGTDEHGFVGPVNGPYETFDVGAGRTQPRSLNNQGTVVGFIPQVGDEFVRYKDGSVVIVTKDGTPLVGILHGISSSGEFVGDYFRAPGSVPLRGGFVGKDGVWKADVDLPFPTVRVAPRGINARGDITGWFIAEGGGAVQGFVIHDGVTTVINFPDADSQTFPESINNKGEISGGWNDAAGAPHGFILSADMTTWTSFDAPEGPGMQAWQINDLGQVAVTASDDTTTYTYIYCRKKGGVCNSNDAIPASEMTVSVAPANSPASGGFGADPDAEPKGKGRNK